MKNKLTKIIFFFLLAYSLTGNAVESNSTAVAKIFDETINIADLEPNSKLISRYKRSYPKLSEEDVLDKMKEIKFSSIIRKRISQKLTQEHNLEPTEEEVRSYTDFFNRSMPSSTLKMMTPQMKEFSLTFNRSVVKNYKMSKYLYETYGGTVIFQQANPQEPVGAYRKLLEEYVSQGKFKIYQEKYKESFWSYYLKDHSMVIPKGKVDFSLPWWEQKALKAKGHKVDKI